MKVPVRTKGRNNTYDANGIYFGNCIIVLKGSRITNKSSDKISPVAASIRNNPEYVSEEMVLLQNVEFSSASIAAAFVTGNISNGLRVWKLQDGRNLGCLKQNKKIIENFE